MRGKYIRTEAIRDKNRVYWTGKKRPDISLLKKGKKVLSTQGDKHPFWKGNNAGYRSIHEWLRRHFGKPIKCENLNCIYPRKDNKGRLMRQPTRYKWAKKEGREYTRDRNDYLQLCPSCHRKYDLPEQRSTKSIIYH